MVPWAENAATIFAPVLEKVSTSPVGKSVPPVFPRLKSCIPVAMSRVKLNHAILILRSNLLIVRKTLAMQCHNPSKEASSDHCFGRWNMADVGTASRRFDYDW